MSELLILPPIETARLGLDNFALVDAPTVQTLAGDFDIARMTELIPHPYPDGGAQAWIATHEKDWAERRSATWAIRHRDGANLLGAISLHHWQEGRSAELGFWLGKVHWGQGYMTEAAIAVVHWGLLQAGLWRIEGRHRKANFASGRVHHKAGLLDEGCLRGAFYLFGEHDDVQILGIVRSDLK